MGGTVRLHANKVCCQYFFSLNVNLKKFQVTIFLDEYVKFFCVVFEVKECKTPQKKKKKKKKYKYS